MKILITGGSGNIGKYLIPTLLDSGHYILNASLQNLFYPEEFKNYKFYNIDISNDEDIEKLFISEKPDIVIHLAGIISDNCEKNRELAYKVNVLGTKRLADLSLKYFVKRFIFSSTSAVYNQSKFAPTKENDSVNPISYYGETKLEAEKYLINLADLPVVILRIFNIYGESFDSSLINKLLNSTEKSTVSIVKPDKYYRDYIYYKDVINIISESVLAKIEENKIIVNVASGKATSTSELINKLSLSKTLYYKEIDSNDTLDLSWADISNLKKYIKYIPSQDIIV